MLSIHKDVENSLSHVASGSNINWSKYIDTDIDATFLEENLGMYIKIF